MENVFVIHHFTKWNETPEANLRWEMGGLFSCADPPSGVDQPLVNNQNSKSYSNGIADIVHTKIGESIAKAAKDEKNQQIFADSVVIMANDKEKQKLFAETCNFFLHQSYLGYTNWTGTSE